MFPCIILLIYNIKFAIFKYDGTITLYRFVFQQIHPQK